MTTGDEDDTGDADLRRAFAALRRQEAATAPPFEAILGGGVGRGRRRLVPVFSGLLAASVLVGLIVAMTMRRPESTPAPMPSIEQWRAPTDFLLRTPGSEILGTLPPIGATPALPTLQGGAAGVPLSNRRSV